VKAILPKHRRKGGVANQQIKLRRQHSAH
jgi:hypothetical protein